MAEPATIDNAPLLPILENSFDGVALVAPASWRLVYVNPTLMRWLHRPNSELCGCSLAEIFGDASRQALMEQVERVWRGDAPDAALLAGVSVEGASLERADVRLCRINFEDTPLLGVIVQRSADLQHDVRPAAERRDPLTGLPDRDFLLARLTALLDGERSTDRQFAVLFIDLDDFKQINDQHGHLVGDRALREVARRLTDCVRDGDHVVRFGGDEFVVLMERVTQLKEVGPVVSRIHAALDPPIDLSEGRFTLSLTIGAAVAAPEHHSPEDVLREADRAMYAAKHARSN